jgi:hypothetical protein
VLGLNGSKNIKKPISKSFVSARFLIIDIVLRYGCVKKFIDHLISKSPIILLGSYTLLGQLNHDLVLAMTANKVI